jgi:hypothetical protein
VADAGSATSDHGGLSRQSLSVIFTHIFSSLFCCSLFLKNGIYAFPPKLT